MSVTEIATAVLPFVYILVFLALLWLIVELVLIVRRTRSAVDDVHKKLAPTLERVEHITASLEPVVSKVDPLVERVSLTVDAANLEIMRIDQILEDVHEITDTVSSAAQAVDAAANAPIDLVNSMTSRVRSLFKPQRASSESVKLGEQKTAEGTSKIPEKKESAQQVIAEERAKSKERHAAHAALKESKRAASQTTQQMADKMYQAVASTVDKDTTEVQERYYTYTGAAETASSEGVSPEGSNAGQQKKADETKVQE